MENQEEEGFPVGFAVTDEEMNQKFTREISDFSTAEVLLVSLETKPEIIR